MLPARLVIWFGRMLGLFWYYVAPIRVGVARANVERVYGDTLTKREKAAIVRGCCMSWAMTVMECLRMPILREPGEIGRMEAADFHIIDAAKKRKKGACVVTLHLGNFEMTNVNI